MNRTIIIAMTVSALAILGCDKPAETKTDPTAATAQTNANTAPTMTAATTTTPAPAAVTIADSDLITAADFEEEVEKAITNKNYKTELASLETEVSKE